MLIGYIGTVVQSQERRIRVSVLIDGVEQPLYRRMDGKVFVPTVPGKPYELRVQGLSDFVEVKCAVDGVDVFSGEPGNYQVGMGFIVHKTSKPLDARQEMDLLVIGYDTKGSLLKRGIIAPADPNPFPDVLTYNARNVYNL
jgi:hypothetical protein